MSRYSASYNSLQAASYMFIQAFSNKHNLANFRHPRVRFLAFLNLHDVIQIPYTLQHVRFSRRRLEHPLAPEDYQLRCSISRRFTWKLPLPQYTADPFI